MGQSEEAKNRRNLIASIGAGVLALTILFISISRASLDTATKEETNLEMRKLPIEIVVDDDKHTYKLPQARTLPDQPNYYLKRVRDELWVLFTTGKKNKSEVALFIADKKMAEVAELLTLKKTELALTTSREALNKLQYAERLYENDQIYYAGFAYAKILANYDQKLKELDDWNQKQQIEKEKKK